MIIFIDTKNIDTSLNVINPDMFKIDKDGIKGFKGSEIFSLHWGEINSIHIDNEKFNDDFYL